MIAQNQLNPSIPTLVPPKFIRRNDLTLAIRIAIVTQAYEVQTSHTWGVITKLSKQYGISRTFIYSLLSTFKEGMENLFFPKEKPASISREEIEAHILAHRFEGKCSIDAISTLLKRFGIPFSAIGSISQFLSYVGGLLPNTLPNKNETVQSVVFADDELFAKSSPILITVEPVSSAILRIELVDQRTAENWSNHLQEMKENGFLPRLSTSDAGTAICAAHEEILGDIPWQLDTFHGVAHRLGDWNRKLEKAAYTAIEKADDREEKLASAKSERVIDNRLNLCFEADEIKEQAIELYDNFNYLYKEIIHQLNVFDSTGNLRHREQAEDNITAALDLIESLNHKTINKEVGSVRKSLPDLLTYFDEADTVVKNCQSVTSNEEALNALCLAWQWDKAVIKSKHTERKHGAIKQRQFFSELAELFVGDKKEYIKLKESIYAELDQIIQASSMVECINSILRPYLNNSKNQLTQEFLNTFMFYHNHRRYHAGKRKGKTPMEILTGKEQKEDWIVLLRQEVKEKELVLTA